MKSKDITRMARVLHSLSEHFGLPVDDETKISSCLKRPTRDRTDALLRILKVLKIKTKRDSAFWNNVRRYLLNAEKTLLGLKKTEIRVPVPKSLKMFDTVTNIRSVLSITDVEFPVPFWFAVPNWCQQASLQKLSEGSFAEVYEMEGADGEPRLVKVVPVGGEKIPEKDLPQLTFKDVATEMRVAIELSKLSKGSKYCCQAFPKIYSVCVVQDSFPEPFIKAWNSYNYQKSSNHPCPNLYEPHQSFVTIETEHAGVTLDNVGELDYLVSLSVFQQVATAVAIAEEKLQFEHRDLHSENIVLKECDEENIDIKIGNRSHKVKTHGIKASIIDFTYSRLKTEEGVHYVDLEPLYYPNPMSKQKFLDHRYVYSKMAEITKCQWGSFCPRTNVLWLTYVLKYLLQRAQETESFFLDSLQSAAKRTLEACDKSCVQYATAADFVQLEILPSLR